VPLRVSGVRPVRVARGRATTVFRSGGPGWSADLSEGAAPRALAAFDPVAGNTDIVGRRRPRKIDLTARNSSRSRRPRLRRRACDHGTGYGGNRVPGLPHVTRRARAA